MLITYQKRLLKNLCFLFSRNVNSRDSNDESPQFEKNAYEAELIENAPAGTTVATVKATDKDSGVFGTQGIRYTSLTGSIANE